MPVFLTRITLKTKIFFGLFFDSEGHIEIA